MTRFDSGTGIAPREARTIVVPHLTGPRPQSLRAPDEPVQPSRRRSRELPAATRTGDLLRREPGRPPLPQRERCHFLGGRRAGGNVVLGPPRQRRYRYDHAGAAAEPGAARARPRIARRPEAARIDRP